MAEMPNKQKGKDFNQGPSGSNLIRKDVAASPRQVTQYRHYEVHIPSVYFDSMARTNFVTIVVPHNDVRNLNYYVEQYRQRAKNLFPKVLPHLHKYLDLNSVLQCRGTCKLWEASVDSFMQSYPRPIEVNDLNALKKMEPGETCPVVWKETEIKRFETGYVRACPPRLSEINLLMDHPRNPFVGRNFSTEVIPGVSREGRNFYQIFLSFMKCCFGTHVWHFDLYDPSYDICTPIKFYKRVLYLLKVMPNLKSFKYTVAQLDQTIAEDQQTHPLSDYILNNPLHDMPQLQILDTKAGNLDPLCPHHPKMMEEYQTIQDYLMHKYSQQLGKLVLDWPFWKQGYSNLHWGLGLQRLTTLMLREVRSDKHLEMLEKELTADVKLPELIMFGLQFRYLTINPDLLMRLLQNVKKACPKFQLFSLKVPTPHFPEKGKPEEEKAEPNEKEDDEDQKENEDPEMAEEEEVGEEEQMEEDEEEEEEELEADIIHFHRSTRPPEDIQECNFFIEQNDRNLRDLRFKIIRYMYHLTNRPGIDDDSSDEEFERETEPNENMEFSPVDESEGEDEGSEVDVVNIYNREMDNVRTVHMEETVEMTPDYNLFGDDEYYTMDACESDQSEDVDVVNP